MLILILILSIAFPVLFLYCCLVVASRSDQAMHDYLEMHGLLKKESEKEK